MLSANADAFRCTVCGATIWHGTIHTCGGTPTYPVTKPILVPACPHCYCKITSADTSGPAHRICCNCSNRQAMATWG